MDKISGFIKQLNLKRTWGVIIDNNDELYYFSTKDINKEPFSLREGIMVSFETTTPSANSQYMYQAISIQVVD